MSRKKLYARIALNLLVTLFFLLLIILLGPKLLSFFLPFVIAYIISSIANPLVKLLEKKVRILRKHGTAIIIAATIIAIVGLLYLTISILVKQAVSLMNDIPDIAKQLITLFDEFSNKLLMLGDSMPNEIKGIASNLNTIIEEFLAGLLDGIKMPSLFETASGYLKSFANAIFMTIITIIASYFFTADRDKLLELCKRVFPDSVQKGFNLVIVNFKEAVGGYFKAQFKIMFIITIILWLTFQVMGINYAVLIAFGIAFIDLLPIFGTGTILGPWALVMIITGDYISGSVLIILYLVCQLVKQLLQPKMVGDSIGINPLEALLFMFIGYRLQGIIGMILGIPVGMVLINFYRIGAFDRIIRGFKIIINDIDEFRKF